MARDDDGAPCIFALEGTRELGKQVADRLGLDLAEHEERGFEDGEHKARPLSHVRGKDVFVMHSLYGDGVQTVNDKLCRMLFFLGAVRDASAARVTAVVPYLCYARKDRRSKARDPLTTRYVAAMFESVGVDRVVTMDVHNLAAFENAFRIRTEHLSAAGLLVDHFVSSSLQGDPVVVSPDAGGVKRAERFRQMLARSLERNVPLAFVEKHRSEDAITGGAIVGRVEGRTAILLDDMIASGGTMARAARACVGQGARGVWAAATHGLFVHDAAEKLGDPALAGTVVTDTVSPFRLGEEVRRNRLTVLESAPLWAAAIERIHANGSVHELFEPEGGQD